VKALKSYIWVLPVAAFLVGSAALFSGISSVGTGVALDVPGDQSAGQIASASSLTPTAQNWTPTAVVASGPRTIGNMSADLFATPGSFNAPTDVQPY